jgi:hypothetical protein
MVIATITGVAAGLRAGKATANRAVNPKKLPKIEY